MTDKRHILIFNKSLPAKVSDEGLHSVLEAMREVLRRMSAGARDIEFRHTVDLLEDRIGGPLGRKVWVKHIVLYARFEQPFWLLPEATQRLLKQYEMSQQSKELAELAWKAAKDAQAEMEKAVLAQVEAQPESVRAIPGAITVPAKDVPLPKMLVSDAEIERVASHPIGVVVSQDPKDT